MKPGKGGAFVRTTIKNLRNGAVLERTFRAGERMERAFVEKKDMQYLYNDGTDYVFMDTSTYEQVHITAEALGDSKDYLIAEMTIKVEFYDVEPVGIELQLPESSGEWDGSRDAFARRTYDRGLGSAWRRNHDHQVDEVRSCRC